MDDSVDITIEDNGIGREAASARDTRKDHKSTGMLISSRRIEVLDSDKIRSVQIEDLLDKKGNALGTKVRFKIPFSLS